jgi:quinol monooxygenase YgiN
MAVYTIARFEVRPDARLDAERAMFELASYVRAELADSSWTAFKDPANPGHYLAMIRADDARAVERHRAAPGTQAFLAALAPLLVGAMTFTQCELVTSSDLARRPAKGRRR